MPGVSQEVLGLVVHHPIGAQRPHQVDVGGATYRRDLETHGFGELHGRRPDGAGRPVHQDTLPRPHPGLAKGPERIVRPFGGGGRLVERRAFPHRHHQGTAGPHRHVLGVGTEGALAPSAHPVTDVEPADLGPEPFDDPGELGTQHRLLGTAKAAEEPDQEGRAGAVSTVGAVDRRRVDPHQQLVGRRDRDRYLFEPHHLWRPVPIGYRRPHPLPAGDRLGGHLTARSSPTTSLASPADGCHISGRR